MSGRKREEKVVDFKNRVFHHYSGRKQRFSICDLSITLLEAYLVVDLRSCLSM